MILNICDNADVQEVLSLISLLIRIICIAVPIILIVSLMIMITKAITNKEEDIFSNMGKAVFSKVIAAILVFFIPTFVRTIAHITLADTEYESCIDIRTLEEIEISKSDEIVGDLDRLKNTLNSTQYNEVLNKINSLPDGDNKDKFLEEIKKIKNDIDLNYLVDTALQYGNEKDYNDLYQKVEALESGSLKNSLREKLAKLKERIDEENSRIVTPPPVN